MRRMIETLDAAWAGAEEMDLAAGEAAIAEAEVRLLRAFRRLGAEREALRYIRPARWSALRLEAAYHRLRA